MQTKGIALKGITGILIRIYRRSPLYPGWGERLAKLLHFVSRFRRRAPFVYDTGDFKMYIDLNEIIDSQIYYTGSFEPNAEATIRRLLGQDAVAVDVGANIGSLTLNMACRVGFNGKVIAFEPTRWAHDRLIANLSLNHMPQVTVERLGLSDRAIQGREIAIQSSYRLDGKASECKEKIDITTLDDYFAKNPVNRLDFIKIDTDGMELSILHGGEKTLRRFMPALLFELGPDGLAGCDVSPKELLGWLRALGYAFYRENTLAPHKNIEDEANQLPSRTSFNVVALSSQ